MRHWCQLSDSSAGESSCKPRSLNFSDAPLLSGAPCSIRRRRFPQPSPTLLIVARPPRFFKRPARLPRRDSNFFVAAISIFSSPRYQCFRRHDIDFFYRRDINFFIVEILINLRRDIDFFFFLAPSPGANLKHRAAPGANFSVAPRGTQISASRR